MKKGQQGQLSPALPLFLLLKKCLSDLWVTSEQKGSMVSCLVDKLSRSQRHSPVTLGYLPRQCQLLRHARCSSCCHTQSWNSFQWCQLILGPPRDKIARRLLVCRPASQGGHLSTKGPRNICPDDYDLKIASLHLCLSVDRPPRKTAQHCTAQCACFPGARQSGMG